MTTYELVGMLFVYTGSLLLGLILGGLLLRLSAEIWIEASRRWRGILKAEQLIVDYYWNRDEYKAWLREKKEREAE